MIRPQPELIEEPEMIMDLTEEPEHTCEKQQQNRSQKRSRSNCKQSTKYKLPRYNEDTTDPEAIQFKINKKVHKKAEGPRRKRILSGILDTKRGQILSPIEN